jgi:putative DNA primase/helicase
MISPPEPDSIVAAEAAVLGSMIVDSTVIGPARCSLSVEVFHRPEHRAICQAIFDCHEDGGTVDLVLLRDRLRDHKALEDVGGVAYLLQVAEAVPSAASWEYYATIVKRGAKFRKLHSGLSEGLAILNNGHDDEQKIADLAAVMDGIQQETGQVGARAVCADSIKGKAVRWLWPNRIPIGMVSIIAGEPGVGKSFLSMMMAATVSTGSCWPDAPGPDRGGALIITGEEDPDYSIIPRLESNGADKSRVFILEPPDLDLSQGVGRLREIIRQVPDCRLVGIDPVNCFMGNSDQNNNSDVRRTMGNLKRLAEDTGTAIVLITHFTKKVDLGTVNRILGSVGFVAAARSVWAVVWDREDPEHENRILVPCKSNYCIRPMSMRYTITDGKVVFDPEPFHHDPDDQEPENRIGAPKTDEAVEFLQEILTGKVSVAQDEIQQQAEARGIKYGTLRIAKKKLPIKSESHGFGKDKAWYWSLENIG